MSIQAQFDNEAMSMLPRVIEIIKNADAFEANQMKCHTIHTILNTSIALDNMSDEQKYSLENELIETFKLNRWIAD